MQAEWWGADIQSLTLTERAPHQVDRISPDRKTQVRQMNANLVRAAGRRTGFEQGRAILESPLNSKPGPGRQPGFHVDRARTQLAGLIADGRLANELIPNRMTAHAHQVNFLYLGPSELRLDVSREVPGASDYNNTRCVGIQSV